MSQAYPALRQSMLLAAALAYATIAAPLWATYESCDIRMDIFDNQDFREDTTDLADLASKLWKGGEEGLPGLPLDVDGLTRLLARECFEVYGNGTFEISVELTSADPSTAAYLELQPAIVELGYGGPSTAGTDAVLLPVGGLYRETLVDPRWDGPTIGVIFHADLEAQAQDGGLDVQGGDFGAIRIVWTARRVRQGPCTMKAMVSGDVSGTFAGDVAFYNRFEEGVRAGAASGTALDPTAGEALEGLTDFSQWATDFLEDDDEQESEVPDKKKEEKDSKSAFHKAMETEWDLSGNDNFGLSLVDVKFDAEGPAPVEGPAGFAGAMEFLGSKFSLAASGVEFTGPTQDGRRTVELSWFAVLPGAMDANLSGVKFLWKPGQPGKPILFFVDPGTGWIKGLVKGDLYTEKPYANGRRLKIHVEAEFIAGEGAFSCQ